MRDMSDERWKPHVTVAAIIEQDKRFLVVEEQTADGLRLNNPAGHLEPGESLLQAVVREVLEETACAFEPEALLGVYHWRRDDRADAAVYLRFAFVGRVGAPAPGRALDAPIVRTLWLGADELRAQAHRHRSPLVMRCIDDHLAGRRFALDLLHFDLGPEAAR